MGLNMQHSSTQFEKLGGSHWQLSIETIALACMYEVAGEGRSVQDKNVLEDRLRLLKGPHDGTPFFYGTLSQQPQLQQPDCAPACQKKPAYMTATYDACNLAWAGPSVCTELYK